MGAIVCGVAVTWAAAGFGLRVLAPRSCSRPVTLTRYSVRDVAGRVSYYRIEKGRCPTRKELLVHVPPSELVDPWWTSVTFHCTGDDIVVRSAGPDRVFHTADDITSD